MYFVSADLPMFGEGKRIACDLWTLNSTWAEMREVDLLAHHITTMVIVVLVANRTEAVARQRVFCSKLQLWAKFSPYDHM